MVKCEAQWAVSIVPQGVYGCLVSTWSPADVASLTPLSGLKSRFPLSFASSHGLLLSK